MEIIRLLASRISKMIALFLHAVFALYGLGKIIHREFHPLNCQLALAILICCRHRCEVDHEQF